MGLTLNGSVRLCLHRSLTFNFVVVPMTFSALPVIFGIIEYTSVAAKKCPTVELLLTFQRCPNYEYFSDSPGKSRGGHMCTTFIRRHTAGLAKGEMFTTRDCLKYGSRAAVDKALSRMVSSGQLTRLARGVFMRADGLCARPSILEIATVKAQSFGRLIVRHGADLAREQGLRAQGNPQPTYLISGSSSSFHYGEIVIHLKNGCMRKIRTGKSPAAQVIRALWQLGERGCTKEKVHSATRLFGRTDRQEFRDSAAWMPAWLFHYFARTSSGKQERARFTL